MQTLFAGITIIPIIYAGCKSMTNALIIIAIIMFAVFFNYIVFSNPKPKCGGEVILLSLLSGGIIASAVFYSWLYLITQILK